MPHVIFLSGASGAGKTTLVKTLAQKLEESDAVQVLHFDTIGVPSPEEMVRQFGSGEAWQKAMTFHWIKTISKEYASKAHVVIEGQVNFQFILHALAWYKVKNFTLFLIHAEEEDRHQRLRDQRLQPELINHDMDQWARFLLQQAHDLDVRVMNTSQQNLDVCLENIVSLPSNKDCS